MLSVSLELKQSLPRISILGPIVAFGEVTLTQNKKSGDMRAVTASTGLERNAKDLLADRRS